MSPTVPLQVTKSDFLSLIYMIVYELISYPNHLYIIKGLGEGNTMKAISPKALATGLIVGLIIGLALGYVILPRGVDITALKQRVDRLEAQIEERDATISSLESQIAELEKLRSQIEEKNTQIASLQPQIDSLQEELQTKTNQLDELQTKLSGKDAEIRILEEKVNELSGLLDEKEETIASLNAQIDELKKLPDYGQLNGYVQQLKDKGFEVSPGSFYEPQYYAEIPDYDNFVKWAEQVRKEHRQEDMSDPIIYVDVDRSVFWFIGRIALFNYDDVVFYWFV